MKPNLKISKKQRMRRVNDMDRWRIEQMGINGGFSHRFITQTVFGKVADDVTESDLNRVRYVLRQRQVKVTDWRCGVTTVARSYAKTVTNVKGRKRKIA